MNKKKLSLISAVLVITSQVASAYGPGGLQLTEYNPGPGIGPQQPAIRDTIDEKIEKKRKEKRVSKGILFEMLDRTKRAFGVKKIEDSNCKIVLKVGSGVTRERVYGEYNDDDYLGDCGFCRVGNEIVEKCSYDECPAEEIKEVVVCLGNKSIAYKLHTEKLNENDGETRCYGCNGAKHYFAHEGNCGDYVFFGEKNKDFMKGDSSLNNSVNKDLASKCVLCELKIDHPEQLSLNRCPVYWANRTKEFSESFLVEVLYKINSGLDFINDTYVGKFNDRQTEHVRDSYQKKGECSCPHCRRYHLKKQVEVDRSKWFNRYAFGEFFHDCIEKDKDVFELYNEELKSSSDAGKRFILRYAKDCDNFNFSVYRQCIDALRIIVENMVKIEIVKEKVK